MRRIKAKLSSKSTSSTSDKDRLLLTCLDGLHTILGMAQDIAVPAGVAVPGLQAGLKGLFMILDVVKVECCSFSSFSSPDD
jgi:hypothetical protein